MPTYNRRAFVPNAIRYFRRQNYQQKELIIIDDGTDAIRDLVPDAPDIRYFRLDNKITLGAKLNLACEYAHGDILANWDDDDWYAGHRLQYQIDTLLRHQTDVCGINRLLYYDMIQQHAYQYIYPPELRVWLSGGSLCYTRDTWKQQPFADINVGMDGLFVWGLSPDRLTVLPDTSFSVHMIHTQNISPKRTDGAWWYEYPVEEIRRVVGDDWPLYTNGNGTTIITPANGHRKTIAGSTNGHVTIKSAVTPVTAGKRLKNVYACLVHEKEDCVADLVRNLRYHDPDSEILLYNGGAQTSLLQGRFPDVHVHPAPRPMKWGYLHPFALDCMEYSQQHLQADMITIVDSDQLAIRSGYTEFIAAQLSGNTNTGMLSSRAEQVRSADTTIYPAQLAYKEYDLWKPFLQEFPNGTDKFLHWTFWPASVFFADAAKELVRLFKTNKRLQDIMQRSGIWATEEIVLPTLVRLLGYEVVQNPCNGDFVKYKHPFSIQDMKAAIQRPETFWFHPVPRVYEDPLRQYAREQFQQYVKQEATVPLLLSADLLGSIKDIEGWLSPAEADLLAAAALRACIRLDAPHHIVEIGSYHGKSTVLLGMQLKHYFPDTAMIYAIDPHEGVIGAADQGLMNVRPTLDAFNKNITRAGLEKHVVLLCQRSTDVQWSSPISLLFIDGLHDYTNVSNDYRHFEKWIRPGGYIAFHDYAHYYPGVISFVNELLTSGECKKIQQTDTMMIVEKCG